MARLSQTPAQMALESLLAWHVACGAEHFWSETPLDRLGDIRPDRDSGTHAADEIPRVSSFVRTDEHLPPIVPETESGSVKSTAQAKEDAVRLARSAETLEDLRAAIAGFEGLAIKRTATNMVFSDGNPDSCVMVVGEAPGAEEDRAGRAFVGASGQLLDRILACIGLSRHAELPGRRVYISNVINWRPPGNRTPAPAEIEISLPFIERHIALVRPRILIFAGAVPAKALLRRTEGIMRLRGNWSSWSPSHEGLASADFTPPQALAIFHPSYLLRTPSVKRETWMDILSVQEKLNLLN